MSNKSTPDTEEDLGGQLMMLTGNAILSWQGVEHMVCEVFLNFFDPSAQDAAAVSYHAVRTFDAKCGMVDALVKFYCSEQDISTWSKLLTAIRKKSRSRNSLAHGVFVAHKQHNDVKPMISRNPLDIANFPAGDADRTQFISAKEVQDMLESFHRTMTEVETFKDALALSSELREARLLRPSRLQANRRRSPLKILNPEAP